MFASPIVTKMDDKQLHPNHTISFKDELIRIKAEARLSKRQIAFRQEVAKLDTFDNMLALEPKILHISCHGVTTPEEALLFEKPGGEGLTVKKDDLQPLFEKIKRK